MTFQIPEGAPNYRYMLYIRPNNQKNYPSRDVGALYPLRPGVRKFRIGIDIESIGEPTSELTEILLRKDLVETFLLVQNAKTKPESWALALQIEQWYSWEYVDAESAPKNLDVCEVPVVGYENNNIVLGTYGKFSPIYSELDATASKGPNTSNEIALEDRHRGAALAAAAEALEIDLIVSEHLASERADFNGNDVVLSIKPNSLYPLFGQYLRLTWNSEYSVKSGRLLQGGSWTMVNGASSISEMYATGIKHNAPFLAYLKFQCDFENHTVLGESLDGIITRLARASKALDVLLGSLSNHFSSNENDADVTELTAEAFDRMLVYLMGALDKSARIRPHLFDTKKHPKDEFHGTLASRQELHDFIDKLECADVQDLLEGQKFAWIVRSFRNQVHSIPLKHSYVHSRSYGSAVTIALIIPNLEDFGIVQDSLDQSQLDSLGIWSPGNRNQKAKPEYVADIATLSTTLFQVILRYLNSIARMILLEKPKSSDETSPHPVIGSLDPAFESEITGKFVDSPYRKMFSWVE